MTATGGMVMLDTPGRPGEPVLRWSSRARSIAEIETELARIWSRVDLTTTGEDDEPARRIAARTSVMNLVVIARNAEIGARSAATIQALTGRHPSRTLVVQSADPDGPSWLDARIEAHCVLPRDGAAETCAEMIHLTAGGEAGRHLAAIVAPLLVHDLPTTVWWPGEPPFTSAPARDVFAAADRLVVDASSWNGDGLARLTEMAGVPRATRLTISDFALVRQSRWREAIASIFDDPEFLPYLRSLRRIAV
ncbi:MAG: glucose-6-phosphate dehydrogenase assembly protein OpcA, partial [Chloroflexi bacterium]|nr:glucose-6-phosphate dehydrogenase assembly protein OpcA [Chloroflexota bacterium]